MTTYTPGGPCPNCEDPIDHHGVYEVTDTAGYALCPVTGCECVLLWEWPPHGTITLNPLHDPHDTNGPSTSE